ncbi:ATR-interacting protein isoform X2 [Cyclopterus lumpus]|uniref:ATR interacting protein n=1 Tax=Cyclopterus lumpus TaxID=8103 RepID=A0A8C3A9K5_CYCLU|nr:ATR-interacting protein isoform X2 [Cyclopterus lumpus]
MNYPPTKRLRGLNQDVVTAFNDPFGDDDDFTQDDLDEIDTIASQAITAIATPGLGMKPGPKPMEPTLGSNWPQPAGQSKSVSRATTNQSSENTFGFSSNRGNAGMPSREPLGNRQQRFGSDREDSHGLLEAQHAELKRKLKEVEEEIVLKSGEIRVLRDSLKGAQQEKETQRQNQIQLEIQRQREQSEKEKELNKKVQSLKSELQFKEAEINEMKTKLHSSDKTKTASPLPRNSPKVLGCLAQLHHGSVGSSSSPTGNGFITKEMFGAHVPSRATTRRDDRGGSSSRSGDKQEVSRPDPFLSVRPAHLQHPGGVLLGLLLQQPLSPSSLGLSHLLSMSLSDIHPTSSKSAGFLLQSDAAVGVSGGEGAAPRPTLSPLQSLAVTGLNMLSQNRSAAAAGSRNKRSCPGAVLFLPLLELHLSRLCQALDSLRSTSAGSGGSNSTGASSLPAGVAAGLGRLDEAGLTGFSVEDTGLAALRLLYLLVAHSDEVVEAVLSKENQSRVTDMKTEHSAAGVVLCSQNALLQSVLRLCEAGLGGGCVGSQNEELVLDAMKTLCVVIERTPRTHADRLQCVLQVVCACLSADCRLHTVLGCVSVLTSMTDHQTLAQRLCSQHDPCIFLKLFQFIRTRPDNRATHTDWILLDLRVVRLLSRLMTQRAESWTTSQHSSCQCYTELVQTVVIVFHRQWLDLRGSQDSTGLAAPSQKCHARPSPWWRSPAASLLRECLLLLHWLLLHHGSFSENCRPLLHMYDQVIPAVRDTLRKIPELSESEELALEEICRSEGDDTDDMDTDTGS